jgi:hypothetical protein
MKASLRVQDYSCRIRNSHFVTDSKKRLSYQNIIAVRVKLLADCTFQHLCSSASHLKFSMATSIQFLAYTATCSPRFTQRPAADWWFSHHRPRPMADCRLETDPVEFTAACQCHPTPCQPIRDSRCIEVSLAHWQCRHRGLMWF